MTAGPTRRFPGLGASALAFFVFLYAPVVVLIVLSFNANRTATIWTGFGVGWYGAVLNNPDILRAFRNSLIVAGTAAIASTTVATAAALGMRRARFPGRGVVTALLALPLVVPEIVTAVATLLFFVAAGLRLGLGTVILAHVAFCVPFAYLPIRARLEGADERLVEAAADLYAPPLKVFLRVTLPLLWPGILAGFMLAFIVSLDDFVITYFVAGAGATTLPIYIFGMIRTGVTPEVNAVSALMLVVSILFVSASWLAGRPRRSPAV